MFCLFVFFILVLVPEPTSQKGRREEREVNSVFRTSPANQFGCPDSRVMPSERPLIQPPSYPWRQAECMSYPVLENRLKDEPRCRPVTADYRYSSIKLNQFRSRTSFPVPMFHPDQFKRRPAEPARLSYSRSLLKYQPY